MRASSFPGGSCLQLGIARELHRDVIEFHPERPRHDYVFAGGRNAVARLHVEKVIIRRE